MIFAETPLKGAWLIDVELRTDARGAFARTVCRDELLAHGLQADFAQQSISWNPIRGTLRGLHFQAHPFAEEKLVRVTRGAIFDVIVDLRKHSATFGTIYSVELSALNRRQIFIPKGFAHGFQTIATDTEILYQMTVPFEPSASRGVLWSDPTLNIAWPLGVDPSNRAQLSAADSAYARLEATR